MRKTTLMFTLVRHTGWTVGGDPCFEHAVEEQVADNTHLPAIAKAGGLLFNSYCEASDRAEAENYPEEVTGLVPRVRGTFKRVGRREPVEVYIPR